LPALAEITYMNSGTEGIMAEPVLRRYFDELGRFERYGYYYRGDHRGEFAETRARLARVVNAQAEEVSVTRSGTDGCAIVLGAFDWKPGDELLIGDQEHPAILYPAFALQSMYDVVVRQFTFHKDPARTLESFAAQLSPRTRLAAFSHVSCETGIRVPETDMIEAAHARGVEVLLDGAQTVGAIPIDFPASGADYLTGSVHKWLCGPKGTGILVIRQDRLDELIPRYVGGGTLTAPTPYGRVENPERFRVTFTPGASRFEFGTSSPVLYQGIAFAVEYLEEIGWAAIAEHEREISTMLKRRLGEIEGVTVNTPMSWEASSPLVNFGVEGISGADLSRRFRDEFKIVQRAVREPEGVRLSCAYFTAPEDVERVVSAVKSIQRSL
jgi:L-cysteine/cystine lyase